MTDIHQIITAIQSIDKSLIKIDKYNNINPTLEGIEVFMFLQANFSNVFSEKLYQDDFRLQLLNPQKIELIYKFWENLILTPLEDLKDLSILIAGDEINKYFIEFTTSGINLSVFNLKDNIKKKVFLPPYYRQDPARLTLEVLRKLSQPEPERQSPTTDKPKSEGTSILEMLGSTGSFDLMYHPKTGHRITLKNGPFGPYIETLDPSDQRRTIKKNIPEIYLNNFSSLGTDIIEDILAHPKILCRHPEHEDLHVNIGYNKKGKYISIADIYVYLPLSTDFKSLSDQEAIKMIDSALTSRNIVKIYSAREDSYLKLYEGKFGYFLAWKDLKVALPRQLQSQGREEIGKLDENLLWNLIKKKLE